MKIMGLPIFSSFLKISFLEISVTLDIAPPNKIIQIIFPKYYPNIRLLLDFLKTFSYNPISHIL